MTDSPANADANNWEAPACMKFQRRNFMIVMLAFSAFLLSCSGFPLVHAVLHRHILKSIALFEHHHYSRGKKVGIYFVGFFGGLGASLLLFLLGSFATLIWHVTSEYKILQHLFKRAIMFVGITGGLVLSAYMCKEGFDAHVDVFVFCVLIFYVVVLVVGGLGLGNGVAAAFAGVAISYLIGKKHDLGRWLAFLPMTIILVLWVDFQRSFIMEEANLCQTYADLVLKPAKRQWIYNNIGHPLRNFCYNLVVVQAQPPQRANRQEEV